MTFEKKKNFPLHGFIGLVLVIVFWYLNWSLRGLRTQWGFFPLWLGYSLTIDSFVFYRKGSSLLTRNYKAFISLFIISAPVWWLFELFNSYTQNWIYDGRQYFTNLQYFLLASLSFSTVIPSVFGTAELFGTFKWINKFGDWKKVDKSNDVLIIFLSLGIILLVLLIIFPEVFYPFVWIIVYFIVDPINVLLKNNSLLNYTSQKDWRPIAALAFGTLTCGFFWEFWNYFSYPQWKYHLPMVNVLHIFEMPLPGYIGYIPFSFELYALYSLITGILAKNYFKDYLQILPK